MNDKNQWQNVVRHQIFIGLNDGDTKEQKYDTEKFRKILEDVCRGYKIAYSVAPMQGGYFHEGGMFVSENSLCLTLIGADDYIVNEIAKDVCAFFNQETVMVTRDTVDCSFVHESIKEE